MEKKIERTFRVVGKDETQYGVMDVYEDGTFRLGVHALCEPSDLRAAIDALYVEMEEAGYDIG